MKNNPILNSFKTSTLTLAFALAGLAATPPAEASTVVGGVIDTRGQPAALNVTFAPLSTPRADAPNVIFSSDQTVTTDAAGQFSLALKAGQYKVSVGSQTRDAFVVTVPEGAATHDWTTLITTPLTTLSVAPPALEERRFRGVPGGYAALDASGHVPVAQLGLGVPEAALFLRGDGTWASPVSDPLSVGRLRLAPGVEPAGLAEGDLWLEAPGNRRLVYQAGARQALETVLFTGSARVVVTNTTAETSLLAAGVGTLTLPANFLTPGKSLLLRLRGITSAPASASTGTFRVRLGSASFVSSALSYTPNMANRFTDFELQFTCLEAGAAGGVVAGGSFRSTSMTLMLGSAPNPYQAGLAVDTTQPLALDVLVTHSATGCSLATLQVSLQVLN
jgi:hypothetical protein